MASSDDAVNYVTAGDLQVAYYDHGDADHPVVMLMHGFPYDIHAYDEVVPLLLQAGLRVIVPYLRGYGPTRFISDTTLRSGEQAVLGNDLLALMDALQIDQAVLGGYDWGGRAACIVAALWPQRVRGLVTCGGYNIQNIATSMRPSAPSHEHRYWYQYYFHSERGRAGLEENRDDLCRLLWTLWSPNWKFSDAVFAQSASALHNADFVDVVIHSYRHRYGLVEGDPSVASIDQSLADQPDINVPLIAMYGAANGVTPSGNLDVHSQHFPRLVANHVLDGIGHNIPQEAPTQFAQALVQLSH